MFGAIVEYFNLTRIPFMLESLDHNLGHLDYQKPFESLCSREEPRPTTVELRMEKVFTAEQWWNVARGFNPWK